jgi:hypothetical protein
VPTADVMFALRSSSALLSTAIKVQPKGFMSTLSAKSKAYMDAAANGKAVHLWFNSTN